MNKTIATAAALIMAVGAAASQAEDLTLVHAINGSDLGLEESLPVDISVRDAESTRCFEGIPFGTIAESIPVTPGLVSVRVSLDDTKRACRGTLATQGVFDVSLGSNTTFVAHLNDSQQITSSHFANDLIPPAAGNGRVIVRHTADAPAVDILADGGVLFSNLSNGNQDKTEAPAASYDVTITAAGGGAPVIDPIPLDVQEGAVTVVFAVSSLRTGNFSVLPQVIYLD